ncbi:MAG: sensor histidine kinase [Ktedonobacteraceae bacterium]
MNLTVARALWKPLSLLLFSSGLFLAYLLLKPLPPPLFTFGDNFLQGALETVGLLFALPILLPASTREQTGASSSHWWAWWTSSGSVVPLLLACTLLSFVIGQVIWTINEDVLHLAELFPTWADAGCLGSYPFVLLAILFLPQQHLLLSSRTRIAFDAVITMTGVVTLGWYFLLGPTIQQGTNSGLGQLVGTAYPLSTLVLIFCLFLLVMRKNVPAMRPVIFLLFLAFMVITITDTIYDYQQLHQLYATGSLLDFGWPLGYLLLGLAARALYVLPQLERQVCGQAKESKGTAEQLALWQILLPYAWVPAVGFLLFFIWKHGNDPFLVTGVVIGAVVLLGLLMMRQFVAMHELSTVHQQLRRAEQQKARAYEQRLEALQAEQKMSLAFEQERQVNRLKNDFIVNVSHELRTPLTTILGYLELLNEHQGELDDTLKAIFLNQIGQGCQELMILVEGILNATQVSQEVSSPQREVVSVAYAVHEALAACDPRIRQDYRFHVDVPEQLTICADQHYLRQVLHNLLSNAFKYAPPHTGITIRAAQDNASASHVCIRVKDEGPGIPANEIPLLFGKFVRLKRDVSGKVRGTGLGLYICKQLVEAMQGQIWVESSGEAGAGSQFCFTLPSVSPLDSYGKESHGVQIDPTNTLRFALDGQNGALTNFRENSSISS